MQSCVFTFCLRSPNVPPPPHPPLFDSLIRAFKPGFHIIVGITGITRIAEKLVQRSWRSQRSQRSTGFQMIAVIAENNKKANHIQFICYVCPAVHPGILILVLVVIFAKFIAQTVILQYSLHEISSIGK